MKATPILIALAACTLGTSGCMKWEKTNSDVEVARAWAPAEFYVAAPEATDFAQVDAGPATPTLDRADWPLTTIVAHNAQPQHQPIYTRSIHYDGGIPRNAGKYPNNLTALDSITTASTDAQVGEALMAPLAAAADIPLFLVRVFESGMWKTVDNGLEPYAREPGSSWQRAAQSNLLAKPADKAGEKK